MVNKSMKRKKRSFKMKGNGWDDTIHSGPEWDRYVILLDESRRLTIKLKNKKCGNFDFKCAAEKGSLVGKIAQIKAELAQLKIKIMYDEKFGTKGGKKKKNKSRRKSKKKKKKRARTISGKKKI